MSDMPGLAAALVAQALFLKGRTNTRALVIGAVVAGLAAGVRVQTACLTLPLFVLALVQQRRTGHLVDRVETAAGSRDRWTRLGHSSDRALGRPRRLSARARIAGGRGLRVDGNAVDDADSSTAAVCALGDVRAPVGVDPARHRRGRARRGRRADRRSLAARYAVLCIALAFGPYAIFHLLFQETIHVRYAMPTLPAMAWLVVSAASGARAAAPAVSGLVVAAALWYAVPTGIAYGQEAHPAFRAIAPCRTPLRTLHPAVVHAHFSLRRPLQAAGRPRAVDRRAAAQLRVARARGLLAWGRAGAGLVSGRPSPHRPGAHRSTEPARRHALRMEGGGPLRS